MNPASEYFAKGSPAMNAKILVPIDFSPITQSVVSWAASLARDRKASLILLHVQEPIGDSLAGEMYYPMPVVENPGVRRALLAVVPDDPTIPYEHRLLLGAAPEHIVGLAEEEGVDLIVMGSHGRGWLGRLLMGSVAENVMRNASCPVLIVKPSCSQPHESSSQPLPSAAAKNDRNGPENAAKKTNAVL
jgi:nucleotide-binding universal stress UspA family protein